MVLNLSAALGLNLRKLNFRSEILM
jgi:hypothetical protein